MQECVRDGAMFARLFFQEITSLKVNNELAFQENWKWFLFGVQRLETKLNYAQMRDPPSSKECFVLMGSVFVF